MKRKLPNMEALPPSRDKIIFLINRLIELKVIQRQSGQILPLLFYAQIASDKRNMKLTILTLAITAISAVPQKELQRLKSLYETDNLKITNDLQAQDDNCVWLDAKYGDNQICPVYYAATGLCGSGKNADCNGYHFRLHCCNLNSGVQSNCQWSGAKYGVLWKCPSGQIMGGGCGSGRNADCSKTGTKQYIETLCCDYDGVTVDSSSYTISGRYGEVVECPTGHVITGMCGSGSNGDCSNNNYVEALCRPYTVQ